MALKKRYPKGPVITVTIDSNLMEISKERDSSHCMIAEAIRDADPKLKSISVDLQTIRFSIPEKRIRCTYLTPRIAQLALINFDQGKTPEPFQFRLAGAHVTRMASRKNVATPRPLSEKRLESIKKAAKYQTQQSLAPADKAHSVLRRVGGQTPPTTPFARRRAFGLRGLDPTA